MTIPACIDCRTGFLAEWLERSLQCTGKRDHTEEEAGADQNQDAAKQTANSILELILSCCLLCWVLNWFCHVVCCVGCWTDSVMLFAVLAVELILSCCWLCWLLNWFCRVVCCVFGVDLGWWVVLLFSGGENCLSVTCLTACHPDKRKVWPDGKVCGWWAGRLRFRPALTCLSFPEMIYGRSLLTYHPCS